MWRGRDVVGACPLGAGDGAAATPGLSPALETALRSALAAQGVAPADADVVIQRLTPAERAELAERAAELGTGGDGFLLVIVLILVAAILLYLPLAGRMQGWW